MAEPDTYAEFKEAVNMTAAELEKWLRTDEAKQVGQKSSPGGESGRLGIQRLAEFKELTDVLARHRCDHGGTAVCVGDQTFGDEP